MVQHESGSLSFKITGMIFVCFTALCCLLPFLLILSGSFTAEEAIFKHGYSLIPADFSPAAYRIILKAPRAVLQACGVSILVVALGTSAGLFIMAMAAYVLSRPDFRYRKPCAFFIYLTSIFSGGLIPLYILMVRYLQLKDTFPALVLPLLLSAWNIFLLRNFMNDVPVSILESAAMDGAGQFRIFVQIVIPLSLPGIMTIGLFQALYYWNDWMQAKLYINNQALYPVQYFLYNMLNSFQAVNTAFLTSGVPLPHIPTESIKMAMTVIATTPLLFFFSLTQRYFIKGLTLGAIKG